MPACEKHTNDRQISCSDCWTNEELEAQLSTIQACRIPSPAGTKSKPKRSDSPKEKSKKRSWMDELLDV